MNGERARIPGTYSNILEAGLTRMVQSKILKPFDYRLFLAIVSEMDYYNIARVDERALAESLDVDKRTVRAGIDRLVADTWMVVERERDGGNDYLIDPGVVWKGQAHRHVAISAHFGRLVFPEQGPAPRLRIEEYGGGEGYVDTWTGELIDA